VPMQTEAKAECLISLRRRAQSRAPRSVGDASAHVRSGATRPHRSRGSPWAAFAAAQTYRLAVSRLVVSSLEVGSAGSEIVCQSNPSRESLASPGAHLFPGAVAGRPRTQPRREFPATGGDRAELSEASPGPSCRRRGVCQALTAIEARWHGRRLGPSAARSRCDSPAH